MNHFVHCAVLALSLAATLAQAQPRIGPAGLLTDEGGRVLYLFDKDAAGQSHCHDQCAALWPPFVAAPDAKASGRFGLVSRPDGSRQWAIGGKPLYFYAGDSAPGQANGDGLKAVWHVVREPAAARTDDPVSYRPDGY